MGGPVCRGIVEDLRKLPRRRAGVAASKGSSCPWPHTDVNESSLAPCWNRSMALKAHTGHVTLFLWHLLVGIVHFLRNVATNVNAFAGLLTALAVWKGLRLWWSRSGAVGDGKRYMR